MAQRAPPFLMRFRSDGDILPPRDPYARTTLGRGGDCRLGRAPIMTHAQRAKMKVYSTCASVLSDHREVHVRCSGRASDTAASETFVLPRPRLLNLTEALHGQRRGLPAQCSKCSAPPDFYTDLGDGDLGSSLPEVSYGMLYRASAERVLAEDLRAALPSARLNRGVWAKVCPRPFAPLPALYFPRLAHRPSHPAPRPPLPSLAM